MAAIASQTYTPAEETEIKKWTEVAASAASTSSVLAELNTLLATRTTVLGSKPSKADVAVYEALAPVVKAWTPEQRTGKEGLPNIVRLVDFVQNSPALFGLEVADGDKVAIDAEEVLYVAPPVDAKAEKERLKKEKAAAAAAAAGGAPAAGEEKKVADRTKKQDKAEGAGAAGAAAGGATAAAGGAAAAAAAEGFPTEKKKKEKKEKQARPPKAAPPPPAPPSPSLIDLRVGHILKAVKHPEADSLYVSTIAMGDKEGTTDTEKYEDGQIVRTVCSGLNGLVPLEEMQGRRVVVVCNLKPVKMRGIKSAAMVLAASPRLKEGEEDHHGGPVELVAPPADAPAGTKVYFEGWKGEPEGQLNPKKKVWEMFQPGFTTTDDLEVGFDAGVVKELGKEGLGKLVAETGGVCTVKSLKGATVR